MSNRKSPATAPAGEFQKNWKMLLSCVVGCGLCMSTIATFSIGPFVKPVSADMGWSRTAVQAALLFGQGTSAFGVIVAGWLIQRHGARIIAIFGLAGTAFGLVLASMSRSLAFFYLAYSIASFIGSGASYVAWSRAITGAFDRYRGLALAIALSGTGLAGLFLPSVLVKVVSSFGWRTGYIALAAFPALVALPVVVLLFRPHHERPDVRVSVVDDFRYRDVFGSYRYWVLLTSIFCVYFSITGILSNLIPALTDSGLSPERAAVAQGIYAAGLLGGRLLIGVLVDRLWAPAVGAVFLTFPALGCFILMGEPSFAMAVFATATVGMASGAELDLLALLTSRYFRLRHFARVYSYLFVVVGISGGTGPMLFAWVRELTGSYHASFGLAAALFIIGGPILLSLGRYPSFADDLGERVIPRS